MVGDDVRVNGGLGYVLWRTSGLFGMAEHKVQGGEF